MRVRAICTVVALVAVSLVVASLAGAAPPFQPLVRYAFPVAAPWDVASPGELSVLLPAEWRVSTWQQTMRGKKLTTTNGPIAEDPLHTTVRWVVWCDLENEGTTLADVRSHHVFHGWGDMWGPGSGKMRQVGETYVALPIGTVWRQTLLAVPPTANGGWVSRSYQRLYWLDRGVVRTVVTGTEKQLFSVFMFTCAPDQCRTHNGQLAAIMQSLRYTP